MNSDTNSPSVDSLGSRDRRGVSARDPAAPFSILYGQGRRPDAPEPPPDYFGDLNLDQIVSAIIGLKTEYDLGPFFNSCLSDPEGIQFRQAVMRDFDERAVCRHIAAFAVGMRAVRSYVERVEKAYHALQRQRWWLDAVLAYCDAVRGLSRGLRGAEIRSEGLAGFRASLSAYAASPAFVTLTSDAEGLRDKLAAIRYGLIVRGGSVAVRRYDGEIDYGALVARTFDKFRQGVPQMQVEALPEWSNLNGVEERILEFVARLNPEVFSALDSFCRDHADFTAPLLKIFDREAQFYIGFIDYMRPFKEAGLPFAYPEVTRADKGVRVHDGFDLALATKLMREGKPIVRNDFELAGAERILVVSGPNQGGKTTLARMFGQLHYLACLGCPVPASEARLHLFDRMFTHFEREESIDTLRGKLQDDLVRIHDYLGRATPDSILIMNEIFTSTTLQDATVLSDRIMQSVIDKGMVSVWVTFIDELASFGPQTVSMVSTVVPDNPAERTFKVVRRPADGLAYALSIAEKYDLTYDRVRERLA